MDRYASNWESKGYASIDEEARYRDIGRSMLISYWTKYDGQFKPALEVEKRFKVSPDGLDAVSLTGVIDRIDLTEDGSLSLLDYKTGKWIPNSVDEMDKLQLIIYSYATKKIWDKPVSKAGNYFLRGNKELSFVPDEEQIMSTMNMIQNVVKGIQNRDFPVCRNKFCNWCDYNKRCETTSVLSVER